MQKLRTMSGSLKVMLNVAVLVETYDSVKEAAARNNLSMGGYLDRLVIASKLRWAL